MNKNNKGLQIVRIKERMKQLNLQNKRLNELDDNDIAEIRKNKYAIKRQDTILRDDIK